MKQRNTNIYYDFGYEDFGPLMYGFCRWLENEMRAKKITKVFFLSRDGYFMKKIFDEINESNIETHYLYASRRLLQVASICDKKTYENIVGSMYFPRCFKGEKLIKAWGCNDLLDIASSKLKDKIICRSDILLENDYISFFEENKQKIIDNSTKEKEALIGYLKNNNFTGELAIVDIGWFGNMQNSFETIIANSELNCNIHGYYLGVNPESEYYNKYKMKGFMFEPGENESFYKKEQFFENVLEVLFSAPHGSAICYYYEGDEIKILLESSKYVGTESFMNITKIQEGAYNYCLDKKEKEDVFDRKKSVRRIYKTLNNPSRDILKSIGKLCLDEDEPIELIHAETFKYYIKNPKKFINDLAISYWKVGFIKMVIRITLPYAYILATAKRYFHS